MKSTDFSNEGIFFCLVQSRRSVEDKKLFEVEINLGVNNKVALNQFLPLF